MIEREALESAIASIVAALAAPDIPPAPLVPDASGSIVDGVEPFAVLVTPSLYWGGTGAWVHEGYADFYPTILASSSCKTWVEGSYHVRSSDGFGWNADLDNWTDSLAGLAVEMPNMRQLIGAAITPLVGSKGRDRELFRPGRITGDNASELEALVAEAAAAVAVFNASVNSDSFIPPDVVLRLDHNALESHEPFGCAHPEDSEGYVNVSYWVPGINGEPEADVAEVWEAFKAEVAARSLALESAAAALAAFVATLPGRIRAEIRPFKAGSQHRFRGD